MQIDVWHETQIRSSYEICQLHGQNGPEIETAVDAENEMSEPAEEEDGGYGQHTFSCPYLIV